MLVEAVHDTVLCSQHVDLVAVSDANLVLSLPCCQTSLLTSNKLEFLTLLELATVLRHTVLQL